MARRKRAPPLSYNQKKKEIQHEKLGISLKAKTSQAEKALITRYHRLLFGGRNKHTGKYTMGIASSFTHYSGKHADIIQQAFSPKGAKRITKAIVPLGYKIGKITKNDIEISSKYIKTKIKIKGFDRKKLAISPIEILSQLNEGKYRLMFGSYIGHRTYESLGDLEDALEEILDSAQTKTGQKNPFEYINIIEEPVPINQATEKEYNRAVKESRKYRR